MIYFYGKMILFAVLLMSIPAVIRFFIFKKSMQVLNNLSNYLSGKTDKLSFLYHYPAFKGEYEGFKFRVILYTHRENRYNPPFLEMSLGKMSFLKLDIFSKKKAMNLLDHNLSAGLKVNIEDEAYNGLPIFTNDNIRVIDYLKDEQTKNGIQDLLNVGCTNIYITGREIKALKPINDLKEDADVENITKVLKALIVLTKRL